MRGYEPLENDISNICWYLSDIIYLFLQVSIAMSGRSWQQSEETEFQALCDPWTASRRAPQPVQTVGDDLLHIRGGPGALRSSSRPEHRGHVQGDEHCCDIWTLTHTLQPWQVSKLHWDKILTTRLHELMISTFMTLLHSKHLQYAEHIWIENRNHYLKEMRDFFLICLSYHITKIGN